jgi:hypothetical protein
MSAEQDFYKTFRGCFSSLLNWEDLDACWQTVRARADAGWYIYAIGLPLPQQPASAAEVERFIERVNHLLRDDHREDYCGIVYVDNKDAPTFIKIFDPSHLGVSCGFSQNPPLPGWIMCRIPPRPLEDSRTLPARRQRWWQALWDSEECKVLK